ncbi:MAG: tail fiber domain-containing protein, partial [Candidatus Gracilibacteria bacterium]|nr:tail fiber domain-containing protein [Candidatus Gracilibacteria bacterium]
YLSMIDGNGGNSSIMLRADAGSSYINSGNVGIGTTSPGAKLDILGDNNQLFINTVGAYSSIYFYKSGVNNGALYTDGAITHLENRGSGRLTFGGGITGAENMVILNNGNVGIGTTAPTEKLQVTGNILASNNAEMGAHPTYPGYTAWWVKGADYSMLGDGVSTYINAPQATGGVYFRVANTDKMTIFPNGNATLVGTLTQASDIRLKKEISQIENPLEKISKLNGVTYYWKDNKKDDKRQIGVIAQDIEKVFPEAVTTDEKGMKSVAYGNLVAPLIEAVKEQQEQIRRLEGKNTALDQENQDIKSRLEILEQK